MAKELSYTQKTFGNQNDWAAKKMKATITNPEGVLVLKPFDEQPNKLPLIISMFPEIIPYNSANVLRTLRRVQKEHTDCPEDRNFWDWYVSVRKVRVATMHHEFLVMFQYLQMAGYYSVSFKPMLLNFRLKQRDGVKKSDVILTEDEIAYVVRKTYPLTTAPNRHKQTALDKFVLALFTGARISDVMTIIKSTDEAGNPVLLYHNHKGTRSQCVAYNPAVEGALQRKLYALPKSASLMNAALRVALFEALPSSSNRVINYYYLQPGRGRMLKTDGRIAHMTFHTARHTFCTRLLRIGISPSIVAQLAGHKNIQTTMRYYNWTREQEANNVLREAYGIKSLVVEKPEWGMGANTKPLTPEIHAAQLPQAKLGKQLDDDNGLLEKYESTRPKRPPSKKRLEWIKKLQAKGIL